MKIGDNTVKSFTLYSSVEAQETVADLLNRSKSNSVAVQATRAQLIYEEPR